MSSHYNWRHIDNLRGQKRINRKLDAIHPTEVIASQLKRCTVCSSNIDEHPMRHRIYCSKSEPCSPARSAFKVKLKTVCYDRTSQCHICQHAGHASSSGPVKRTELSLEMKAAVRELVEKDVKPARIRNELVEACSFCWTVPADDQVNIMYAAGSTRTTNAKNAEEGERNNRRMERLGQPMVGWTVDLGAGRCGCRASYKFGACVHLLACLKQANQKIPDWPGTERRFVDRRVEPSNGSQRGRPAVFLRAMFGLISTDFVRLSCVL